MTQNGIGGGTLDPLETKAVRTLRIAIPVRMNRTNGLKEGQNNQNGYADNSPNDPQGA
jgi:hypothetical protein